MASASKALTDCASSSATASATTSSWLSSKGDSSTTASAIEGSPLSVLASSSEDGSINAIGMRGTGSVRYAGSFTAALTSSSSRFRRASSKVTDLEGLMTVDVVLALIVIAKAYYYTNQRRLSWNLACCFQLEQSILKRLA